MNYYPVYLNLQGRPCVVIGGGPIAEGKVWGLLTAEALVTVISPALTPGLHALAIENRITHIERAYQPGDLESAFLAISATDDETVNQQVWHEASARNIPVNVVDRTPLCSFIAPAIVRQGDLIVAISTSGKAPALAARLREQLSQTLGDEYARFLNLARELREPLTARWPDFEQRKALWYQLVDSDVLDLLRRGDQVAVHSRIIEIMGVTLSQ